MRLLVEFHSYHHLLKLQGLHPPLIFHSTILTIYSKERSRSVARSEPIIISEPSYGFPAVLCRQAANRLKLTGDCFGHWSRSSHGRVDLVESVEHVLAYLGLAGNLFSCLSRVSFICCDQQICSVCGLDLPASVATHPGLIDRVLMPSGANSAPNLVMIMFMPALPAEYPTTLGIPVIRVNSRSPLGLEMKMIFFSWPLRTSSRNELMTNMGLSMLFFICVHGQYFSCCYRLSC